MNYKRSYVRLRNHFKNLTSRLAQKDTLTDAQQISIDIVKKAIYHLDADLLIAPVSDTRYIRFSNIFIRIENANVTIINGLYSYHIVLPEAAIADLCIKFNTRLEKKRKRFEQDIMVKMKRSLSDILTELN